MNPNRTACFSKEFLSKNTLLAMLKSHIDTTKVIEIATRKIINVENISQSEINEHLNNRTWTYFEVLQPRRMLLMNPNWNILSFDPATRNVCVQMINQKTSIMFNFTLPQILNK